MGRAALVGIAILLAVWPALPGLAADAAPEPDRGVESSEADPGTAGPEPARIVAAPLAPVSQREGILAGALGVIIVGSVASFLLAGRVSPRVHVALALCSVLVAGFALLILYGSSGSGGAAAKVGLFLGLLGMFKLMNQFEIVKKAR